MTGIALIMFALTHATLHGAHVRVDIFDHALGHFGRVAGDVLARLLSSFVLVMLVSRAWDKMLDAYEYADTTNMLSLPLWPFYGILAAGIALCLVVYAVELALILVGARTMTPIAVGLIGIAYLFLLMLLRTPMAFAMMVVGFFGMWVTEGLRSAGGVVITESYSAIASYSLIVAPMFVLLGNVSSAAGFSSDLYDAAYAWVGRFRGGLASASVLACAAFAAVCGSSVATAVTLGKVALPEMRRLGYASGLSTGAIAAGGTLAIPIPSHSSDLPCLRHR